MATDDGRDPDNPLDMMMPPTDNPEYHRKLKEHRDKQHRTAEAAVLNDPSHAALAERLTPVRQGVPQAAAPQPLPPTDVPPVTPPADPPAGTGITVDPTLAQVDHTPVEPRLPEGAGGAPAAPPAPAPAATEEPRVTLGTSSILLKLREDFGIDSIPLTDITVGDHTFTMRVLTVGSVTQALRFADTLSMPGSERENAINLQIALTSFAIVAIDGDPVYKVFEVPIPDIHMTTVEGQKRPVFAPHDPPPEIKVIGATQLMDFLSGTASASLLTELWEQYGKTVDPQGALDQMLESLQEDEAEAEADIPLP